MSKVVKVDFRGFQDKKALHAELDSVNREIANVTKDFNKASQIASYLMTRKKTLMQELGLK